MRSRLLALAEVAITAGVLAATGSLLLVMASAVRGQTPPAAPPAPGRPASPPQPGVPPTPDGTPVTELSVALLEGSTAHRTLRRSVGVTP